MSPRPINLLPKDDRTHLLKIAIGACLSTSAIMVFALTWKSTSGTLHALIGKDPTVTNEPSPSANPDAQPRAPKLVSDNPAGSLFPISQSDTIRYYEEGTGKSFEIHLRTREITTLSEGRLPGFVQTIWSPSGQEVVSVFDSPRGEVFRYFNYTTKQVAPVGTSVTSAVFSPKGNRLALIDGLGDNAAIYTSNPNGTEMKKILATRAEQAVLTWPREDILVLTSRRLGRTGRDLSFIGLDGKISIILSNKDNLEHTWSRDGQKILYSYFEKDQGAQLWLLDLSTQESIHLSLKTSASKCAWTPDSSHIVCGVPVGSSLVRDVSASQTATLDDIVVLNPYSGEERRVYSGRKDVLLSIRSPLVSSSGSFLVFQNLFDRRLYSLELQ